MWRPGSSRAYAQRIGTTVAVAAALVLGVGVAPASAVPTTVPSLDLAVGEPFTGESREYGSWTQAARRIPIGPDTASLRVDGAVLGSKLAAPSEFVSCQLKLQKEPWPVVAHRQWTPAEWAVVADRTLPLPARVADVGAGTRWVASCTAGGDLASASVRWLLTESTAAPALVELGSTPHLLVTHETTTLPSEVPRSLIAVPGERIRLYGQPGTWGADGVTAPLEVTIGDSTGFRVPVDEVVVTPDRSILGFTVPEVPLYQYTGKEYGVHVTAQTVIPGTSTTPKRTIGFHFRTTLDVTRTKPPTDTKLTLSTPITASLGTVTATAEVSTISTPRPLGTLAFHVDGKRIASVPLRDVDGGVASVTLPRLARGSHEVLVTFSGTYHFGGFLASSVSSTQRLLVVR